MTTVRFDPRFAYELEAAIDWYESVSESVADDLRQRITDCVASISAFPESHPIVDLPFRVAIVRPFPWLIVYREDPDLIVFLRFVHSASAEIL